MTKSLDRYELGFKINQLFVVVGRQMERPCTHHFHPGNPPRPFSPVTPAIRNPEKSIAMEPLALRMQARLAISSLRYHEPIMY